MEQSANPETLETSLIVNIWVQRWNIIVFFIVVILTIYVQLNLIQFVEVLLGAFLWTSIFMFGFLGIAAHIRYYFHYEKNRKVALYPDKIVVSKNNDIVMQVVKHDIVKIILRDKIKSYGYNLNPSFADPFYYLIVIYKGNESVILTCLLDLKLKKKISSWYGKEFEHSYQFFPFPTNYVRINAERPD